MFVTDTIADFLTRIRNASSARHKFVDVMGSNMNRALAQILQDSGYVEHFMSKSEGGKSTIRIYLRYGKNRTPVIHGLSRISTPGCRCYAGYADIPKVFNGYGIAIVSTSQGVMTGVEARKKKVGGELLCKVW